MALALRKRNNAVDERFGGALRGLQVFTLSVLLAFERQTAFLHAVALRVQIPVGQTLSAIIQRCPNCFNPTQVQPIDLLDAHSQVPVLLHPGHRLP